MKSSFPPRPVSAIIREGATQKLYNVITSGGSLGMQFMDQAVWEKLRMGLVTPFEAYMKAIDKKRFQSFLPKEILDSFDAGGEPAV